MKKLLIIFLLRYILRISSCPRIILFAFFFFGKRVFLIYPRKKLTLTYKEFSLRVKKLCAYFKELGLERGEIIGYFSYNSPEYFEIRAAAHLYDCIFFALPYYLELDAIAYLLNKTGVRLLFYRNKEGLDLRVSLHNITQLKYSIDLNSSSYEDIFNKKGYLARIQCIDEYVATVNLSSGTTGKTPKIVELTYKNWYVSVVRYLKGGPSDYSRIVFLSPLSSATAGSTTFFPLLLAGATNIIVDSRVRIDALSTYIRDYKVTHLYLTPSWFINLWHLKRKYNCKWETLQRIILGTERMPPLLLKRAVEDFGPIFTIGYGMVEALPPLSLLMPRHYFINGKLREVLLDTVGKPLGDVRIRILNREYKELKKNKVGYIAIESATVAKGYRDNELDTRRYFKGENLFISKDIGFLDRYSFLHIRGRIEEVIYPKKREEEILYDLDNERVVIFAKDIEDKFYTLEVVKRCVAIASSEKEVVLFISLWDQRGTEDIVERIENIFCKNFGQYLSLKKIIFNDNLPLTPLGKLDRSVLEKEVEGLKYSF